LDQQYPSALTPSDTEQMDLAFLRVAALGWLELKAA
jgi:hypothetical protein